MVTGVGAGPAHGSDDISSSYGPLMVLVPMFCQTFGFGKKKTRDQESVIDD